MIKTVKTVKAIDVATATGAILEKFQNCLYGVYGRICELKLVGDPARAVYIGYADGSSSPHMPLDTKLTVLPKITVDMVEDALCLVLEDWPDISQLNEIQLHEVFEWASAEFLDASDNVGVKRKPKPEFLN